jgi:hypothetical protein
MWYTSGSGQIQLKMTLRQAHSASHQGQCDADVLSLMAHPAIRRQLARIEPALLARELREYGAWDTEQLSNHEDNLMRLVWIAAGDIAEEAGQIVTMKLRADRQRDWERYEQR